MRNDLNHPTEFHSTAENPAYTTWQVKRAAHVAQQLLDYTETLYRYVLRDRLFYHLFAFRLAAFLTTLFSFNIIARPFLWKKPGRDLCA